MPSLRPTSWQIQERVFLADGFQLNRINGDHRIYTRKDTRPVVIPMRRNVRVSIILSNMRTASLSRERYFELLASI